MTTDDCLEPRLSTKRCARLLGTSQRHVIALIEAGALAAIDVRAPGARRSTWAVSVSSLRAFVASRGPHEITSA